MSTTASNVTVGCLVRGYFPEPVTVSWDTGSLTNRTVTFNSALHTTSGLYTTVSQITTFGEWTKQKFTCSVFHSPSNASSNKTFKACSKNFTLPTVEIFHSSCDPKGDSHSIIKLLCLISGYTPGDIKVRWLVNGQEKNKLFPQIAPPKLEGKLASTHSELNITQGEWASAQTFTCEVAYEDHILKGEIMMCPDSSPRGVMTYLSTPSPIDLYVHKKATITCLVVDLASSDQLKLTWSRKSKKPVFPSGPMIKKQHNGTVTVTSTLPIETRDWIENETYECSVTHPDLPKAIFQSIHRARGNPLPPEIYVFQPPEEKHGDKSKVTLACLIQNFFPADISVQWLQGEAVLSRDQYSTTGLYKAHGPRPAFFVFSRLQVSRVAWERQDVFYCHVVHEALDGSRSLKIPVSKGSELNLWDLCTEEPESEELDGLWTSTYIFITLFLLSISYSATVTLVKVKWIFSAMQQKRPQTFHDYKNMIYKVI